MKFGFSWLGGFREFTNILSRAYTETSLARVGISGTTAKSRQRKFVPSSHPGPLALVASSHKSQTKVGTLACLMFCKRMSKLCRIRQCYSM